MAYRTSKLSMNQKVRSIVRSVVLAAVVLTGVGAGPTFARAHDGAARRRGRRDPSVGRDTDHDQKKLPGEVVGAKLEREAGAWA